MLDLFLDADRGAGDELGPLLVDQKDRARVRIQQLVRPLEQSRQQLVELEMDERRVRQRLQALQTLAGSERGHEPLILAHGSVLTPVVHGGDGR